MIDKIKNSLFFYIGVTVILFYFCFWISHGTFLYFQIYTWLFFLILLINLMFINNIVAKLIISILIFSISTYLMLIFHPGSFGYGALGLFIFAIVFFMLYVVLVFFDKFKNYRFIKIIANLFVFIILLAIFFIISAQYSRIKSHTLGKQQRSAILSDSSATIEDCKMIEDKKIRNACYKDFAVKSTSPRDCMYYEKDEYGDNKIKDCLSSMAERNNNLSICYDFLTETRDRDECIRRVLYNVGTAVSDCNQIQGLNSREWCLDNLIPKYGEEKDCNNITSSFIRNNCIKQFN